VISGVVAFVSHLEHRLGLRFISELAGSDITSFLDCSSGGAWPTEGCRRTAVGLFLKEASRLDLLPIRKGQDLVRDGQW
jgi:hypothetical protein